MVWTLSSPFHIPQSALYNVQVILSGADKVLPDADDQRSLYLITGHLNVE